MKQLVVFDLDGTLAESKSALDSEMAVLFNRLLSVVKVAVISGGDWPQFEKQLLSNLGRTGQLGNLSLLPTCGTKFFQYRDGWQKLYADVLSAAEKRRIIEALGQALDRSGYRAATVWGDAIEDRDSQITLSALGQQAPLAEKAKWDPDFAKRTAIKAELERLIPEFSIRMGGATSIDVTKPGIDKAYGLRKLSDIVDIGLDRMIFIGDALFPGGNDYPAIEAGVTSIRVRDPEDTKRVIETIIACLGD